MSINLVEATIADLQQALSTTSLTSVDLVSKYLLRIATYDSRGPCLNSIPILNPHVFDEAAASDARRASKTLLGPLDGIPYTLKDSMKYKGMTCSTGSPAFEHLVANEDSFVAEQLRKAGAVCIGRTNTPPMMASGMHRGVHGRAESPYNLEYLTAAFSSGSSNGSATSTAASFAAFGLGSETVSSGRSPASNNGLVAYTPSRTVISPRGCWPLYPTCDVLVPHTRSVGDMLAILDVLTQVDSRKDEDFWRLQEYVDIPHVERPQSYPALKDTAKGSLKGKRIAVPLMYIGGHDPKAKPTVVSQDVLAVWQRTRKDLESLGATVIETDFPLVTNYEDDSVTGHANNVVGFDADWNSKERGELVAYLWDDFLKTNADPNYPDLASIDGAKMFPRPEGYIPDRYMEHKNFMNYPRLVEIAKNRPEGKTIWDVEGISRALPALEAQRKRDLEEWMDAKGVDVVVFPANGDVGRADLDTNDESARLALQNGVKYSNGNRAIRHMGVPTVSVTMGQLTESKMPLNLTFAGKHGQDTDLLKYAYDFEQSTKRRFAPPVTPALSSDTLNLSAELQPPPTKEPSTIEIKSASTTSTNEIHITASINPTLTNTKDPFTISAYIDGKRIQTALEPVHAGEEFSFHAPFTPFTPPKPLYGGVGKVVNNVLVVILAKSATQDAGALVLIDQNGGIKG
ncbi:hypothetical protein M409DRAFT_71115 [Zasmidium cellare ATCC 36951]|uniref:Amidase domain-containing protein n=1 Tax=Zasmidium cellare ATCC 36951 TaxID=1080233 RepID=A0A6A6BZL7_ZASCE|nr:uncharacterized protein M409DRAFT_71115 [Zasmidium cellare ATCC 36951]KAF2159340.1 hypothetical protein M409DRAFT_71115 [Zasmidium cellare ATCC 36951]